MPGDLATTSPVDLCLQLAGERATGTLAMSGPRGDAVLVFADGRLAGARPATEAGARLGERLVSAGRLDSPDLEAVLTAQSAAPQAPALGRMLIERGMASSDAVRLLVQEQVIDTLLDAISWMEGTWEFEPAGMGEPGPARVGLPVDRVLVEVRRRAAERNQVATVVSSTAAVPSPVAGAARPSSLSSGADAVLGAVDGVRTVGELAEALGCSHDELGRQLYRLALQGLVEFADTVSTTDETAAPTEEAALPAPPATGTPAVHLADDGWTSRRDDAAATIDEPEPWVGWANGAPTEVRAAPSEPGAPAASRPTTSGSQPLWAPQREAPPTDSGTWQPTPATAPGPTEHLPTDLPASYDVDADTRRALFSELHEVGRANPTLGRQPAAPASAPPGPSPETMDAAAPPDEADADAPEPAAPPMSRSDVSDLLRELHALNLDDD